MKTDDEEQALILKYWFDVQTAIEELDDTDTWIHVAVGRRRRRPRKKGK